MKVLYLFLMRSWTPPAAAGLLCWKDCCWAAGEGGEGGGSAGTEEADVPNSSMNPGSSSLKRETAVGLKQPSACWTFTVCFRLVGK